MRAQLIIAIAALALVTWACESSSGRSVNPTTAKTTPVSTSQSSTSQLTTPTEAVLSFDYICHIKTSELTELQLKAYAESFKGKPITAWTGYVYDASAQMVQIAMESKEGQLMWTRDIELYGIPTDVASGLNVNQRVTFSGTIKEVNLFVGTICNPLVIENATLQQ